MARNTPRGECFYCSKLFTRAGMTRHLATCPARKESIRLNDGRKNARPRRLTHLCVAGLDRPEYWMHLEMPADTTLDRLDNFLRDTWLECCGHMSAFYVGDTMYSQQEDDMLGSRAMAGVKLGDVLGPGDLFGHDYDFGSTTTLRLSVRGERTGGAGKGGITVMARNHPPEYRCACGQPATRICGICNFDSDTPGVCDACAPTHACGEEMLLPLVNSPRTGVCGYTG